MLLDKGFLKTMKFLLLCVILIKNKNQNCYSLSFKAESEIHV